MSAEDQFSFIYTVKYSLITLMAIVIRKFLNFVV